MYGPHIKDCIAPSCGTEVVVMDTQSIYTFLIGGTCRSSDGKVKASRAELHSCVCKCDLSDASA